MQKLIQHIPDSGVGSSMRASLRAASDQVCDAKDWARVAETYRDYLRESPQNAAIWIQYGHALKEQGLHSLADAEKAYRQSIVHAPEDAAAHLQLGHALKLQGRLQEAGDAYARSLELTPSQAVVDELQELKKLGVRVNAEFPLPSFSANAIFFEIDDLLGHLRAHTTLSGIQRVQVGILQQLLWDFDGSGNLEFVFVRSRTETNSFWRLDPLLLNSLINYCVDDVVERGCLDTMLSEIDQTAIAVHPVQGNVYFVLGSFWGTGDVSRYARIKMAGVCIGVYIYDLIPISHPEYCDEALVSDFTLAIGDGLSIFDFVLTISEFSAQAVRDFIMRHKLREIPVKSVLLAHVMMDKKRSKPKSKWSNALEQLHGRPYVMSVSTIEARKNHGYLIEVWKLLLKEGLELPDLVFVGRYGWRVNDFMEQLRATDFLGGRVHILHDLPDIDLEILYQNCLFTAFPSFVEGWGLPVGESLTNGQVCIAANTSSIPEVGGDLVDYIDPYNVRNGVEVFRRLMIDQAYLEQRRNNIRHNFRPRSWKAVTADLLDKIAQVRSESGTSWHAPLLRPGEIFRPADLWRGNRAPRNYPSRPLRLILSEGWYPVGDFGVWMCCREAKLEFSTELEAGTEVVIYMALTGTVTHEDARALIVSNWSDNINDNWRAERTYPAKSLSIQEILPVPKGGNITTRLLGKVNTSGNVALRFQIDKEVPPVSEGDPRRLSLGLLTLAYAPRADAAVRADIMDTLEVVRATMPDWRRLLQSEIARAQNDIAPIQARGGAWPTKPLLPEMSVGAAGTRVGVAIQSKSEVVGDVAFGPYLRLAPGKYEALIELEQLDVDSVETCVICEVRAGEILFGITSCCVACNEPAKAAVRFEVPVESAALLRDEHFEIRISLIAPASIKISAVDLQQGWMGEPNEIMLFDWMGIIKVGDGSRQLPNGTILSSAEPPQSHMVFGPYVKLLPGIYECVAHIEALGDDCKPQIVDVEIVSVDGNVLTAHTYHLTSERCRVDLQFEIPNASTSAQLIGPIEFRVRRLSPAQIKLTDLKVRHVGLSQI